VYNQFTARQRDDRIPPVTVTLAEATTIRTTRKFQVDDRVLLDEPGLE
jgi:hypothetical protein